MCRLRRDALKRVIAEGAAVEACLYDALFQTGDLIAAHCGSMRTIDAAWLNIFSEQHKRYLLFVFPALSVV